MVLWHPPNPEIEYRDIPGFDGYKIGCDGTVWTSRPKNGYSKTELWRQVKPVLRSTGYLLVTLGRGGKRFQLAIHRLLLEIFVGPCPDGMQACHYDDDKANNQLSNLRWGTSRDNHHDAIRNGRKPRGEKHHNSKLTSEQVAIVKTTSRSARSLAKEFGVRHAAILDVRTGKTWRHV